MLTRRHFFNKLSAATAGVTLFPSRTLKKDSVSFINVIDAGAKGDGVFDPENRLYGNLRWHCGYPTGDDYFPIEGASHMVISKF